MGGLFDEAVAPLGNSPGTTGKQPARAVCHAALESCRHGICTVGEATKTVKPGDSTFFQRVCWKPDRDHARRTSPDSLTSGFESSILVPMSG
ncbi:MAG TPA: hypothetical protein PLA83_12890 [Deltaproteobacteria bacterium]|nr:hypothetical protein [Deltaproteobacteria bacterium]